MFELHGGPGGDTGLKVLRVPEKYRTIPAEVQGVAVNVGEAGPEAQDPMPPSSAIALLDAVERLSESGQRVTLWSRSADHSGRKS